MNTSHIIGKKKNRLNRLQRRLTDPGLVSVQRNMMTQRLDELSKELSVVKK